MQNLSFVNISDKYIPFKNEDPDGIFNKIYSKFTFLFLPLTIFNRVEKDNENMIIQELYNVISFLLWHLKGYNFLTYKFANINENLETTNSKNSYSRSTYFNKNISQFSRFQPVNVIIVSEDKCFIIEKIDYSLFNIIINRKLSKKASQKHVIDTTNYSPDSNELGINDIQANEEIDNFIKGFKFNIKNNLFIKYTIRPIIGYLIRRYSCPTSFFNDPSFFTFSQDNYSKERETKNQLNKLLFSNNKLLLKNNFAQFTNQFKEIQEDKTKIREFQLKDFIILRTLHSNYYASFYIVIHIESLYIFMLKKYFIESSQKEHEKYFCENFSHRCFTKFYGFVKENKKTIGFVYQYMCNKSLEFLVQNQPDLFNNSIYSLMTINRILQGMNYLHQNMLIHRDLKPSNIMIDNDFIPYVSDVDEVCHFDNNNSSSKEMTRNIGSFIYASPEQQQGEKLTNMTDIFSFGMIIYFIYEKKNYTSQSISEKGKISLISKAPENIQNIFKSCVKFKPSERMKNQEIKSILFNEASSFSYIDQFLLGEESTSTNNLSQFLLEILFIAINNIKMTNKFYANILIFNELFLLKYEKKYSLFYSKLGDLLIDQN